MTKTRGSGGGLADSRPVPGGGWAGYRRPHKTPASLKLSVEGRNLPAALPKFHVMAIDELPGVLFRSLIVGAYKRDCPADMTILVEDVRSIFGHSVPQPGNLSITEIEPLVCKVPDSEPYYAVV
jgi:hypothetical protein